jgi:hypothetical protein
MHKLVEIARSPVSATPRPGQTPVSLNSAAVMPSIPSLPVRSSQLLFFVLLGLLAGCGSSAPPSMTGTWTFYAISSLVPSQPPKTLTGTLTSDGKSVTGTLAFSNSCFSGQKLKFSGALGDDNIVTLNSKQQVYNNQIVYLSGTVASDGSLVTAGSYTVAASDTTKPICDTGDAGSLTGNRTSNSTIVAKDPAETR